MTTGSGVTNPDFAAAGLASSGSSGGSDPGAAAVPEAFGSGQQPMVRQLRCQFHAVMARLAYSTWLGLLSRQWLRCQLGVVWDLRPQDSTPAPVP